MNRYLIPVLLPAAALPLLVDASLKGGVLLVLAILCAFAMRGASAAARHMVWLSAMIALLLLPLLAGLLPGWRVLPEWATVKHVSEKEEPVKMVSAAPMPVVRETPVETHSEPITTAPTESPAPGPLAPAGGLPAASTPPAVQTPAVAVVPAATPFNAGWVSTVWFAGCAVLLLRLTAAHWLLRRAARRCEVVTAGPLAEALREAQRECGVRQPVRLLLDEQRTIPVVWGIFRPQLLLPADAEAWDAAQLRSVLLHELAHIHRRDTAVQALTGVACALHWFNPLVWFAAWRLHMERERACDDLVLARGVRPSEYAGHLLHVAAEHTAARWTAVCGLAMARKSSLEGRLLAVLSEKLNRRGLTRALALAALLLSAAIAVPVAMLRAAEDKAPAAPGPGADTIPPSLQNETSRAEAVERELKKLEAPAGEPEKPRTAPEAAGAVVHVDPERTFVLIHAAAGVVFTAGQELECSGSDARIRVTKERRKSFFAADVVTGAPARGDAVAPVKDAKTAGLEPQHPNARVLYRHWQSFARTNGDIPGGLIGRMAEELRDPLDEKMKARLARCDASRDWSPQETVQLLDEFAKITPVGLGGCASVIAGYQARDIRPGQPLPDEFKSLSWGAPDAWHHWNEDTPTRHGKKSGLRAACVPEHPAESYPAGSVIPVRIHFHNTGSAPLVFVAGFRPGDQVSAQNAAGRKIKTEWSIGGYNNALREDMGATFRLEPGEWCSTSGGKLILADGGLAETPEHCAAVILAAPGENVRATWLVMMGSLRLSKSNPQAGWNPAYQNRVRERIMLESPVPKSPEDRAALIRRVTPALTGIPATEEEVNAFAALEAPDALEQLITRLQALPPVEGVGGVLKCGEISFKVTSGPGGDYRGKTAAATAIGIYELSGPAYLRHYDKHANVEFMMQNVGVSSGPGTHTIELKETNGHAHPHAFVWQHGKEVLWLAEEDRTRSFDFTDPYQWKETSFPPGSDAIPENLRGMLPKTINFQSSAPPSPAASPPPAASAAPDQPADKSEDTRSKEVPVPVTVTKLKAGLDEKLQWGETVNGLRAALVRPAALDEPPVHEAFDFKLVVQNVSDAPISVSSTGATANTRYVKLWDSRGILSMHHDKEAPPVAFTLQPGEVATMRLFKHVTDADSITGNSDVTFVAEFKIERPVSEKEGTWSGNLITAKTAGMATGHGLLPKDKSARELFKRWSATARRNEQIPGALIGLLAEGITKFTDYNPDWPTTPQLLKLRARCDATHDWSGLDAIALLDEIAAVQASPIGMALEAESSRVIRTGKPLPKEFAKAAWGEPAPNGLRHAWYFEPGPSFTVSWASLAKIAWQYPLGTALPARALIHNSGKEAIVFRAHSWNQPFHQATDASGAEVKSMALEYMTLSNLITFRLAPGEYAEVNAPGIGVGPQKTITAKKDVRVGTYFEVKEGDTMTVTTEPLPLHEGNGKTEPEAGAAELWWLEFIRARLSRDLPLPAGTKERELILYRAAMDLFGTPVSAEINAAFAANQTPSALDALTRLLASRPGQTPFAGNLQSGATTLKVTAPAPETGDAKKKAGTVSTDTADAPPAAAAAPAPAPAATAAPEAPAASKRTAAYPLFKEWQSLARVNGKIPGALIGELKKSVETFVKGNPTWPTTPKLLEKLPLLDASHDWDPAAAAQLVDEIMSIQEISGFADGRRVERGVRTGTPLPPELANAPWGEALPTGLHVAWMVGEGAAEYRLGTPLKSRVLVHNAGKQTIVFRTHTWHQSSGTARDAKGAEISVSGISWMTRPPLVMFRLAPGEYIELTAPGIGVGEDAGKSEWADVRVGTIIEAKEGDEVTFTPGLIPLVAQTGEERLDGEPRWWQDFILDRLRRELPLPADAAERKHLLDRAVREIFGSGPTEEETAGFIADQKPTALDSLAERLAKRPNVFSNSGALASAATKFRVLAADPDAAKKPRVVLGPGEYPLSDKARLVIVGRPVGDRRTNDAVIRFSASPDETAPRADYKLNVPDGYGTWAIVCRPGTGVFWLLAQSGTLKVLYNDPAGVQLFAAKPGSAEAVPEEFRVETQRIMTLLDVAVADVAALAASAAAQDDPDFKKGESLYAAGSMEEAIAAYLKSLKKLPAGRNRIMALFHMGEAHRSLAAKAGTTEEGRAEHLRLAEECDRAVMAGSTISSGPGKFGRFEPCETAVCFISWRRAEASYKEAQAGGNPKKYDEAIGDFLLAWEIARNPASELGGKNAEMTAGALYHVAKCHALQGDKVRAKDSFQQVLQVEGEQAKAWQEKAREELKMLDSAGPATPKKVADTPTPPAANQAGPKPEKTHLFNDKYSAIAVQSGKEVHFVIAYAGMMSSGMSEWATGDGSWGFEGQVHLVDVEKTKRLGKNADKRVLSLKYTSAAPDTLLLDGKAYELRRPLPQGNSTGMRQIPGRIFMLRDNGEPLQTDRTLPLRDEKDLVTIGDFAVNDALMMETYADSRRVLAMSGWVIAWDSQHSIQHGDGERVAMLRVFADGRVLWLPDGRKLTERKITPKEVQALLGWLAGEGGVGEWKPELVKTSSGELERDPVKNVWDRETDVLFFTLDGKRHGLAVESGGAESEAARRIWAHLREQMEQAKEVAFREWSAPFQSLAKLVAESRGLTDWSMDDLVAWGPEKDGLRAGVLMPARGYLNKSVPVQLVLRNVSSETKELRLCTSLNVLEPVVRAGEGMPFMKVHKVKLRGGDAVVPVTLKPGAQYEFAGPPVQFGISKDVDGIPQAPEWPVCGVDTGTGQVRVKFPLENVPGPETGEVMVKIGAAEK